MTTQHQITLPEPDWVHWINGEWHKIYNEYTVRALLAAAVAKERESQDTPAKVVLQQMRRITELEAENAQLREQNETQRYEIQALEEKVAELRGKRVALSDGQISLMAHNIDEGDWNSLHYKECWYKGFMEGARATEAAHGIGEAL